MSVTWFPFVLVCMFVGVGLHHLTKTDKEVEERSKSKNNLLEKAILLIATLSPFTNLMEPLYNWVGVAFGISIYGILLMKWSAVTGRTPFKSPHMYFLVGVGFFTLICIYLYGISKGYGTLHDIDKDYRVGGRDVQVLRSIERGLLYRDSDRGLIVFSPVGASNIERPYEWVSSDPKVCVWFGVICPAEKGENDE